MNRFFVIALTLSLNVLHARVSPNVVIFVADDMAWEDCGAYGHPSIRTPNMDALAKAGLRFDRAYLTCSSCSPSRCSMLTGRYPHATQAGELHLPLPDSQMLLTKPLRAAGYWTAAVGKWHLGESVSNQVDYRKGSKPSAMGEAWVTALRERPKDKPFFLWAAHSDPHRGYQKNAITEPHTAEQVAVPPYLPDTPEVRADLALYYDEVSRFDAHIGQVLAELDRQKLADNTLVLVISDNGRPFPYCKTMVHVPGVRTPFIMRWPGNIAPGCVSGSVVSTLDIAPTVLALAGLKALPSFQGVSLVPLFTNPNATVRSHAFAEHNWHDYRAFERAVHTSQFCYVRNWLPNTPGTPPADAVSSPTFKIMKQQRVAGYLDAFQEQACFSTPRATEFLYDVEKDPHCLNNLAANPELTDTLDSLRATLKTWQTDTQDVFPGEDALSPDGFGRDSGKKLIVGAHPSFSKRD